LLGTEGFDADEAVMTIDEVRAVGIGSEAPLTLVGETGGPCSHRNTGANQKCAGIDQFELTWFIYKYMQKRRNGLGSHLDDVCDEGAEARRIAAYDTLLVALGDTNLVPTDVNGRACIETMITELQQLAETGGGCIDDVVFDRDKARAFEGWTLQTASLPASMQRAKAKRAPNASAARVVSGDDGRSTSHFALPTGGH
jgi:hypothetical protein